MKTTKAKERAMRSLNTKVAVREPEVKSDSGVLDRSLGLLAVLVEATHPMTLRELAEMVQLHDSTVHRLLQALCDVGYVAKSGSRRYFALGKSFLPLTVYHPLNSIRRESYETLCELRDLFGVTAALLIFIGTDRMLVEVAGQAEVLTPFYGTHLDNPLHASAAGKLLLQYMSQEERDAVLGPEPYPALTPLTITSREELAKNLEAMAAQGYSLSVDENFTGQAAMAAPLFAGPGQVTGALALVGPTSRFNETRLPELAAGLKTKAQLISIGSRSLRAIQGMFVSQYDSR